MEHETDFARVMYDYGSRINLPQDSKWLYPALLVPGKRTPYSEGSTLYTEDGEFHYVVMERGRTVKHFHSTDLHDLLYHVFSDITFSLALSYELKNRVKGQDTRRLLFSHQLSLLGQIDDGYRQRRAEHISQILAEHPYKDVDLPI